MVKRKAKNSKEYFIFKYLKHKQTVNVIHNNKKNWKLLDNNDLSSVHLPTNSIKIDHKRTKVIASPYKEVKETNNEFDQIISQNNYTNQMLQTIANQSTRIKNLLEESVNIKFNSTFEKGESSIIKKQEPIFKPFSIKDINFSFKSQSEQYMKKVLEILNKHKDKNINTLTKEEIIHNLEKNFKGESDFEINKINNSWKNKSNTTYYKRPTPPSPLFEDEPLKTKRSFSGNAFI